MRLFLWGAFFFSLFFTLLFNSNLFVPKRWMVYFPTLLVVIIVALAISELLFASD